MSREFVNSVCAALPGAEVSDPWGGGHDAWKVGGKMFAITGSASDGVSVKTADASVAEMLIEAGIGIKAPYLHASWVRLPWGTAEDEVHQRVLDSYRLIRGSLPKKFQAGLEPI